MKKLFVILVVTALSLSSNAQDTIKVKRTEQYAEMIAAEKIFSTKVTITIDYGQEKSLWKDNRIKAEDGRAATFNSVIDAMNYMNGLGWDFINAFPVSNGNGSVYHFFFKRRFDEK